MIRRLSSVLAGALVAATLSGAAQAGSVTVDIAIDPGFENAGDSPFPVDPAPGALPPGWVGYTNGGIIGVPASNPNSGTYAALLFATDPLMNPLIKNANLGIGVVQPNSSVSISFAARGSAANGGVAFAEFFSELAGGGTSSSEILGGGPLALSSDPEEWSIFNFTATTGPDVSGGVTLQFAAVTGGDFGSSSTLHVDDISVKVMAPVPLPAAGLMLAAALGLLGWARRRPA